MISISRMKNHMYEVVGAIHEVHGELGAGLNESCYQEGFQMELTEQGIPFHRELTVYPKYHGRQMSTSFRIDFLCKNDIVVECKAVSELLPVHRAQLFNYMRLLRKPCGILVNFATKFAAIERYLFDLEEDNIMGMDGSIIQRL